MHYCPCGSEILLENCCAPYVDGKSLPDTAEALMRSRYTAYSQANIDYIGATMTGPAAQDFDIEEAKKWAKQCVWRELRVLKAWPDPNNVNRAFVEFIAAYSIAEQQQSLHETSEFQRIDGRWFYVDGTFAKAKQEKVGRNSPCSCGSGKKFKFCCAGKLQLHNS